MNEEDLPIDIHYNKLLDWLLNRRHCKQQWQGAALEVREKINVAIQDMPPVEEITQLLKGTYINYMHCLHIVELLKRTDDGSKNFFGRYSSNRMKDWLEIIKLYEMDGVWLAELAQLLMRNVNYEIPALKKQIAKHQQTQADSTRREAEYITSAGELKEKYQTKCKHMGIQGKLVRKELLDLVKDLPATYTVIETAVREIQSAVHYYNGFIQYMLNREETRLPLLCHLLEKGNTTTFEWNRGRTPVRIEEPTFDYSVLGEDEPDMEQQTDEIDFGDLCVEDGITAQDTDIDWGIEVDSPVIEVVDDSSNTGALSADIDVARGSEALSLLDNPDTRNVLLNELMELQAFLTQREQELADQGNLLSENQLNSAPRKLQVDQAGAQSMLGQVSDILEQMTNKRMQDLYLIRSSPRYVDRLADSLKKILQDSEKMMSLSRLMVTRRQEAGEEEKAVIPQLELIRKRTKELKKQIEGEISKKYKNRRVNIMGEINTV